MSVVPPDRQWGCVGHNCFEGLFRVNLAAVVGPKTAQGLQLAGLKVLLGVSALFGKIF